MNNSATRQSTSAPKNYTLTITADSLCMVRPNGWEIQYAQVSPGKREIESALRHARNIGARIIDERVQP
jgi:hypothetical protein